MKLTSISDLEDETVADHLVEVAGRLGMAYDEWLEQDNGGSHAREAGIHASELKCLRKVVLSIIDAPKVGGNKKFWRQRFNMGKYMHLMMQDDFARMAAQSPELKIRGIDRIEFQDEIRISPKLQAIAAEYNMTSACDGIFNLYRKGETEPYIRVGLEVKSESPDQYSKVKVPKVDHMEQAHFYMKALDLPLMWFFYMDRGSLQNTPSADPFLVKFDPKIWAIVYEKIMTAQEAADVYLATGDLPPREEGIHCEFCSSRAICRPDFLTRRERHSRKL